MYRARRGCRFAGLFIFVILATVPTALPSAHRPLRPFAEALALAPPEVLDRVRADAFTYFRFIKWGLDRARLRGVCGRA